MEEDQKELQFLHTLSSSTNPDLNLNLSLSISKGQPQLPLNNNDEVALKRQKDKQMQLGAMEKAYVERLRELAKRELELADSEFAHARMIWERAREDMEKVEMMKVTATRRIGSACIEFTSRLADVSSNHRISRLYNSELLY